jgi:hypothetical protein
VEEAIQYFSEENRTVVKEWKRIPSVGQLIEALKYAAKQNMEINLN